MINMDITLNADRLCHANRREINASDVGDINFMGFLGGGILLIDPENESDIRSIRNIGDIFNKK